MIRTGNTQNQPTQQPVQKIDLADSEIVIVGKDEAGNQIAIIKKKEKKAQK
jgi:hypothetical protein